MLERNKEIKVSVIGCGYVGLTTAACLANLGHKVIGVETSLKRLTTLQKGQAPFFEKDLNGLVKAGMDKGNLLFTQDLNEATKLSEVVFICVPTPSAEDGSADLSILRTVIDGLSGTLAAGAIIVLKSTVPIGTNQKVGRWLGRNDIHIASNPEFLQAGRAVETFQNPDRIVIGSQSPEAVEKLAALYEGLQAPIVRTDAQSAELIKYASNTYLATRLSFVNTIATLCEKSGADATTVLEGMGLDKRIGTAFLLPGPGWGGSCFPKDTRALVAAAEEKNADTVLLQATLVANENRFDQVVERIEEQFEGNLQGVVVAQWGLTFKAGTDDLRESPALQIAQRLLAKGVKLQAYDPLVNEMENTEIQVCGSALEALNGADVLLVVTEWAEFAEIPAKEVTAKLKNPRVVDARGLLSRKSYLAAGAEIVSVGISR
jgi:UDPglucose 6-dehydrogenase